MRSTVKRFILYNQNTVIKDVPVGINFSIQCHFDIEKVLVLPHMTAHVIFSIFQLIFQLSDCVLHHGQKKKTQWKCIRKKKKPHDMVLNFRLCRIDV